MSLNIPKRSEIKKKIEHKGIRVYLDDRDGYTPGWKFNEWEVKGVPLRIELGPKDLQKQQAMVARRDNGEKQALPIAALTEDIELLLKKVQEGLFTKARKHLENSKTTVETLAEAKKQIENGKLLFVPWCESEGCEESFKFELGGAKTLNAPLEQPKMKPKQGCFACDAAAKRWFYVGKSY